MDNYNIGIYNLGEFNLGICNFGVFNTNSREKKIKMFNKVSSMTLDEWKECEARQILCNYGINNNNLYRCNQRYEKPREEVIKRNNEVWQNLMTSLEREKILSLENFDSKIFSQITGIIL